MYNRSRWLHRNLSLKSCSFIIKNFAFTLEEKERLNVLKTPCSISETYDPQSGNTPPNKKNYLAI